MASGAVSSTNSNRATWYAPRSCANAARGAASASTTSASGYGSPPRLGRRPAYRTLAGSSDPALPERRRGDRHQWRHHCARPVCGGRSSGRHPWTQPHHGQRPARDHQLRAPRRHLSHRQSRPRPQESHPRACEPAAPRTDPRRHATDTPCASDIAGLRCGRRMETLNPKTTPVRTPPAETTQILLHPERRIGADMALWRSLGGGKALARAAQDPAAVREEVRLADLRGLGGSGFPAWRKWDAVAAEMPKPDKYLIVNGNEDEPGTFKDRMLLEETPHQVIEGAAVAALAVGANRIVFYINPDMARSTAALKAALEQWRTSDLLALASTALGKPLQLDLLPGSGHYIGGEETASMEWVESRFPFPRGKPPYPAQAGVYGCPPLINNVETLANVQ